MIEDPLNTVFDTMIFCVPTKIKNNFKCVLPLVSKKYENIEMKISNLISRGYEKSAQTLLGGVKVDKLCPIPTYGQVCVVEIDDTTVIGTIRSVVEIILLNPSKTPGCVVIKELYIDHNHIEHKSNYAYL